MENLAIGFKDWIKFLLEMLNLANKKKSVICKKCGYKFKFNRPFNICRGCIRKVEANHANHEKLLKWHRRFKKDPTKCPVCREHSVSPVGNKKPICPKCHTLNYT
ncbi:MAG: hypothetical protein ABIG20_01395 [archaeon]